MTQNPNERNVKSDTGGISNSHSGEMNRPELLWPRAVGEAVRLCSGESAAGAAAFCQVIYVHARATKCRNKIGAHSEMNSGLCGLLTDSSRLPSTTF